MGCVRSNHQFFLSVINQGNQVTKSNLRDSDGIFLPMDRMQFFITSNFVALMNPQFWTVGMGIPLELIHNRIALFLGGNSSKFVSIPETLP